jgi:hypothetical protein
MANPVSSDYTKMMWGWLGGSGEAAIPKVGAGRRGADFAFDQYLLSASSRPILVISEIKRAWLAGNGWETDKRIGELVHPFIRFYPLPLYYRFIFFTSIKKLSTLYYHSTVTDLARLRGWSTSQPRQTAMW